MLLIGWLTTIYMCLRQMRKFRHSVSYKDRSVGLRRQSPHNLSRIQVVSNPKDSVISIKRNSRPNVAVAISQKEGTNVNDNESV